MLSEDLALECPAVISPALQAGWQRVLVVRASVNTYDLYGAALERARSSRSMVGPSPILRVREWPQVPAHQPSYSKLKPVKGGSCRL
jgi:hypothetical protein